MTTKNHICSFLYSFILFLISFQLVAQPTEKIIKVVITPDHVDWVYKKGEPVKFSVSITRNNELVPNAKIRYEVGPEMMPVLIKDSAVLKDGAIKIEGGTMKEPGFLRCKVVAEFEGNNYLGFATAAYNPELIKPTTEMPSDFVQFWENGKRELAKIPIDAKLTMLPDRCTSKVNVYEASVQNFNIGSRLYGILCVPKKAGKYPALLRVPGAGIRSYAGDIANAENGIITFEIGIHGISVTMDASVYNDLSKTALNGYPFFNLDNRDNYYYKKVYLGCVRAIDFLFSLPEFDGSNIAVTGGSQGGALSIVTAGLDPRVKCLAAFYPALCDLTGYLHGRAGGWPHMFRDAGKSLSQENDKIETSKYYDVVNFARLIKVPGLYSWGYNDVTCPPTSTYSAYSVITAPKSLFIVPETGHWTYPEQNEKARLWLLEKLTGNSSK